MVSFPKPLPAVRRLAKHQAKQALLTAENKAKLQARRRDGYRCRFPLCGCRRLGLRLEVAHMSHKGAGGNPSGDKASTSNLVTLCVHRHQDGAVSWHHGSLRVRPLGPNGTNGPVAWLVATRNGRWVEVARERAIGQLEPLTPRQQEMLAHLARMTA